MKNSRRKEAKFNPMKLIPIFIFIVVIMLTIGYSTSSDNLVVGNAKARIMTEAVVRVTGANAVGSTNGGTISFLDYGVSTINADFSLPNANSTVTIDVYVTNAGNVEMGIMSITGLPSNLKYTLTGYNLETSLCDSNNNSKCTLGSVTHFQMTIDYDENGYDGINTLYSLDLEFEFEEMLYTARIGQTKYLTIQAAIDAAPTDGTETTIVLLKNVYQRIQIWRGNNIVLDMANLVLHNKEFTPTNNNSGDPVVEIFGARDKLHKSEDDTSNVGSAIFKMINGTILSEANQGAINVELGGTFIMTGGSIICSGNRQAVYVKSGGLANISGTSYLRATAEPAPSANPPNYRATVHNAGGTLVITGGTFEAVGANGVALTSDATTTVGTKDGTVNATTPVFIAETTGMYIKSGTTFNFYDGIAKGKVNSIVNENEIDDMETGYNVVHAGETINGNSYLTAYLSNNSVTLTFNPNQGSVSETTRTVAPGVPVGPLPIPIRQGYDFDYWYDSNGDPVGPTSTISADAVYTAHWTAAAVARINHGNGNYSEYSTLAAAIGGATNNTQTVIEILKDVSEKVTIASAKNIVFDFGSYKLSNPGTGDIVVTNNGTLELRSGTITTNATKEAIANNGTFTMTGGTIRSSSNNSSAVNVNSGATMSMSSGSIIGTGSRQAIYVDGGTLTISGDASLTSAAKFESGKPRATVQANTSTSVITILGGTIVSTHSSGIAVTNLGTVTIGTIGGGIDTTTPVLRANGKAIYSTGTLNIYDGILQCKATTIIDGTITNSEPNTQPNTSGSVQIGGTTFHTWYLESTN